MTEVQQLARFVTRTDFAQISPAAVEQLKIRVLDTLGVAVAALDAEPMIAIRGLTERLGGNGVDLFVDHSQILQLEGLRQNIWGNKSTWGRIANPAPKAPR